jgi:hypothetical protein
MRFVDPTKPYRKSGGLGHPGICCTFQDKECPVSCPAGPQRLWTTEKKQVLDSAAVGVWHGRKHHAKDGALGEGRAPEFAGRFFLMTFGNFFRFSTTLIPGMHLNL